jgi:2-polyprenyl-3-methyl-5-hydroxy-6-metoxy-1,4-benzoquinol methylase
MYESGYYDFYASYNQKQLDAWDRFEMPWLLPYLPADKYAFILDVGCGPGLLLGYLDRLAYQNAFGIDISSEQVMAAQAHSEIGNKVRCCDFSDTLNWTQTYNVILAFDVIEHFNADRLLQFPKLCKERLKGTLGSVIIRTANAGCLIAAHGRYIDLTHTTAFTEWSLRQLMALGGFVGEVIPQRRGKALWKRAVLAGRDVTWRAICRLWESRPPECCDAALAMVFKQKQ